MAAKALRFSPKQLRVLTWWQDPRWDALICDGAVRSGKTFAMGLSFFLWAQAGFDGKQFGICGKTISSVRRNLLTELAPCLRRLGMEVRERRGENALIVRFRGHENTFLLFGGRDESSAALIQGSTLAGVLLDEAALMPRSFVEQAAARCSVAGSRLWFNCNPEGPQHWFYQEWILKAEERRALRLHFTMEDNPALPERIRERYRRNYSGAFYRRFVLGEWTAAEGLIYDFFDPSLTPEAIDRTIRGCGIRAQAIELGTNRVRVVFPETAGVPAEFEQIRKIVMDILPCHLGVEFYFRFLTWEECEAAEYTWALVEEREYTWEEFQMAIPPEAEEQEA